MAGHWRAAGSVAVAGGGDVGVEAGDVANIDESMAGSKGDVARLEK